MNTESSNEAIKTKLEFPLVNYRLVVYETNLENKERLRKILQKYFPNFCFYSADTFRSQTNDIIIMKYDEISAKIFDRIDFSSSDQIFVLVSKNSGSSFVLEAIEKGVAGFVLLPIKRKQLLDTVLGVIERLEESKKIAYYQQELEKTHRKNEEELILKKYRLQNEITLDRITGLLNRNVLELSLENEEKKALLYINIENFSAINDGYGYKTGDKVLKEIADFLIQCVPANTNLYRFQADEFIVVINNPQNLEEVRIAQNILSSITGLNIEIDGIKIKTFVSIGIADSSNSNNDNILQHASLSCKEAKKKGKNNYSIFNGNHDLEEKQKNNINWLNHLNYAIEKGNLVPFFQAINDNNFTSKKNSKKNKFEKYEVLSRMILDGKIISPYYYLEAAKIGGLLSSITKKNIELAFPLIASSNTKLSINITDQDFNEGYLNDYLKKMTHLNDIPRENIILEIREDVEAGLDRDRENQLIDLKKSGFQIALDDFGVSCSNFSKIYEYKPDFIKIDGQFIKDIDVNKESYNITRTITQFAHNIGSKVIAEYVHSRRIQNRMTELEIDFSQGYYFSEPKDDLH